MARIALDAMGGDHAPQAPIAAALLAAAELGPDHTLQLVGQEAVIREELAKQLAEASADVRAAAERFEIIHAPDVITMSDKPSVAIRGKPNASMGVGLRLQPEGKSDAFVSAGNTGAQMAASVFILRLHEGLQRPAIGTVFPTATQPVVVLDSGANVDCSPQELLNFAQLGHVYAKDILGRANPAIGLLSVGEEAEKGSAAVKEAHQLLLKSGLNFVGNVEGRDIPLGACDRGPIDVVVCDGFTGNVLLKFYEAAPKLFGGLMLKAGVSKETLGAALGQLDYAKYGGAPLLGVKGVSIICHGKSSPEALKNGIKAGLRAVVSGMSRHIGEEVHA
ncbi:MAG: phosphate acyltransferase PlsX [Gemmatimonadaceae bacterium]|nr:phosphate acyltransferase PlsX [Gemmatimonadaceae bacterium]MCW5825150.1 phosphate acyltransferase PlsX [Gemmatimonadaceae bacterium]